MKTFILAIIVFALIIGLLIFTGWTLARKTDALSAAARRFPTMAADDNSLPSSTLFADALKGFLNEWHGGRKTIHFLIGHEEADRIDDAFAEMQCRFFLRDRAGYMNARDQLLRAIEHLADTESFSFDAIT